LAYDWHLDPYSRGTWCVLRKGQMTHYLEALRQSHGLVHFAGGDFALGWRGFIDGAIESGTRVARQVAQQLRGEAEPVAMAHSTPATVHEPTESELAFRQCAVCHPTDASGQPGVGPNLRNVLGRPQGSDPRFTYSEALQGRGASWTDEELDAFLANPAAYAPGTTMPFAGLGSSADREAVIRFLRGLR
jgi:cytochrome c2